MRFEINEEARFQLTVNDGEGGVVTVGLDHLEYVEIKTATADHLVIHHSKVLVNDIEEYIGLLNAEEARLCPQDEARENTQASAHANPAPPRAPFKCDTDARILGQLSLAMPDGTMADITTAQYEMYVNDVAEREGIEYQDVSVQMMAIEHGSYLQDMADSRQSKVELSEDWIAAKFEEFRFNEWDAPEEINQPRIQMRDTVMELDMWSRNQGQSLADHCEKLRCHVEKGDLDALAIADFNSACFEPEGLMCPEDLINESVRHRYEFIRNLFEQTEFMALHEQTQLNPWASEAATASICQEYVILKNKEDEQEKQEGAGENKPGGNNNSTVMPGESRAGTGNGSGKDKVNASTMAHEIRQVRAISRAVVNAKKEVDTVSDIAGAFGFSDIKECSNNIDRRQLSEVFKRCQKDRMLAKIAEFAGRYRRLARSKNRTKLIHGKEETVGIKLGGQISLLLRSQLVRLMLPQTRLRQMNAILQKQALQKNKKAMSAASKGPIMILVDESGSMSGERIMQAKGLCLAMAWLAKTQGRWFCAVSFSSSREVCQIVLDPRRQWPAEKLMDWCGHFFGGGTEPPLGKMKEIYASTGAPAGKTDLIFITDGDVSVSGDDEKKFTEWKKEAQVKTITLFIQSKANGSMARVSDEQYEVSNLDVTVDGIEACVSI